jgi:ubiquinone/menaquinone biosynthesis C-methylase UbiE
MNIKVMNKNQNKNHWDNLNINYNKVWQGRAKQEMSKREVGFINHYLKIKNPKNILDLGCGTGRILNNLVANTNPDVKIDGIDISSEMVKICKKKFKNENKIKFIEVCDISNKELPFSKKFDFITAIRVLKYNRNWDKIIEKIYQRLNNNGILIFEMLNNHSINRLFRYDIPLYRTTPKKLKIFLKNVGFEILEIRSFTRVPDFFYGLSNNKFYVKALLSLEKLLEFFLGKVSMGRILFLAVKK